MVYEKKRCKDGEYQLQPKLQSVTDVVEAKMEKLLMKEFMCKKLKINH